MKNKNKNPKVVKESKKVVEKKVVEKEINSNSLIEKANKILTPRAKAENRSKRSLFINFSLALVDKLKKDTPYTIKLKEVLKDKEEKYIKSSLLPKTSFYVSAYKGKKIRFSPKVIGNFTKLNGASITGVSEVDALLVS